MFCPNCGFKLSENANFCGNCGARVSAMQKQAVQSYQARQTPVEEEKKQTEVFFSEAPQAAEIQAETVTEAPVEKKTEAGEFFTPPLPQTTAWGNQPYSAPSRKCPYCSTEVAGGATYCPSCKSFVAATPTDAEKERKANKRNTVAFVGFIVSLASIVMSILMSTLGGGIAGIILGIIGHKQIKEGKGKGKGFATAAIVLGIVAIVICIVWTLWSWQNNGAVFPDVDFENGGVIV